MKRNCIFTNKPANSKFTIGSDKQNWAKSVPCTKEYLADRGDKPPTELEIRLIELFYEQELCRLRIDEYDAQMDEIRSVMSNKLPKKERRKISEIYKAVQAINKQGPNWENIGPVELAEEDKEWLNAPMGLVEEKGPNKKETRATAGEFKKDMAVKKEALKEIGFEEDLRIFDNPERFVKLKEQVEEECPNPKCPSMLLNAPGIGPFCPNKECEVGEDINGYKNKMAKKLTFEPEPVKVEKKVVKKKPGNLWD
jgi:hypothetical protein